MIAGSSTGLIVCSGSDSVIRRCRLYVRITRKRPCSEQQWMAEKCQSRPNAPQQKGLLFDHLVGDGKQRRGHLVLSFERQPEDELTVHRHNGVEVETDMVIDRGHVAPSALQWMAMLQAAAAGGIEDQVYRRLSLISDKRLGTPTEKPNCHRRFAIGPNLEFCGVDRVPRHQ